MALQPDLGPVARRGHRPRLSRIGYARALGDKYGAGRLVPHRGSGSAAVLRSALVTQDPVLSSWQGEYLNSTKSLGAHNPIMINREMTRAIVAWVAFLVLLSCWTPEARPQPTSRDLPTEPAVLTVGRGKKFSTIATAVAAARNGDTIEVQAGTYIND